MKKFKVGDKVIRLFKHSTSQCGIVIQLTPRESYVERYRVILNDVYNTKGENIDVWVGIDDIEIDKEYYRESKINELLNIT